MPPRVEGSEAVGRTGDRAVDASVSVGLDIQPLVDPSTEATAMVSYTTLYIILVYLMILSYIVCFMSHWKYFLFLLLLTLMPCCNA